jgi:hypothetical protein
MPGHETFTFRSPRDHTREAAHADTPGTMERTLTLAFMAAVTCYLLARVFAEAATGPEAALELVVYGVTAAFGLEFLIASWRSLWTRS